MSESGADGEVVGSASAEADRGKRRRRRMLVLAIGVVAGAVLGFGYYKLVGCSTGACPITSNPWVSTVYGAVLGGLFSGGV